MLGYVLFLGLLIAIGPLVVVSGATASPVSSITDQPSGSIRSLSVFGAAMVYSATRGTDPAVYDTSFLERQIIFIMVGSALMAGTARSIRVSM